MREQRQEPQPQPQQQPYPQPGPEPRTEPQPKQKSRAGRCSLHPDLAEVARCIVCRRALCVECAIPVRRMVVGAECLPAVLEDVEVPPPASLRVDPRADIVAAVGFGLVLLLSVFPWSRFGDVSGNLEAWSMHWSLLALGAAGAGLLVAVFRRLRPPRLWQVAAVYALLALVTGLGAVLHAVRPPPLSAASTAPVLAVAGAAIALVGAGLRWREALKAARRP